MLIAFALAAASAAPEPGPACPLIFPVAPDEAAARRIATAVIASRPHPPRRRYVLVIAGDREDPRLWLAYQKLPSPRRPDPPGRVTISAGGGGGLAMRIDRCTGEVSRLHYSR